jgi:multidrug efflux pump subunit AcrB
MTAIATVLGMIPMATGLGEGSETNMPLARAVIGGLTVSTALTLLVVPIMYVFFERLLPRRRSREA